MLFIPGGASLLQHTSSNEETVIGGIIFSF